MIIILFILTDGDTMVADCEKELQKYSISQLATRFQCVSGYVRSFTCKYSGFSSVLNGEKE